MPIAFSCSGCDKTFRVADEMAGKKAKCPSCATVLTVPAAGAVTAKPRPKPPPLARSAKAVPADYDDDEDQDEGAPPSRRPAARTAPARRRAVEEDEDDRPRRRSRDDDDLDDEDDEEFTPRKKRGKKNLRKQRKSGAGVVILIVGLAAGVVLLLGGGGVLAWFLLSGPTGINEAFVYAPDGVQNVVSARIEDLMQSQLFNTLKAQNPEINKGLQDPQASTLINKGIIQMVFMTQTSGDPVVFVKLRQSITVDEVKSLSKGRTFTTTQARGYTIHAPQFGEAFCLINSRTILLGNKDMLGRVLERNKKPVFSKQLERAVAETNWSRSLAFAVGGIAPSNFGLPGQMNAPTDGLESVAGYVDVGTDVRGHITGLCRDNQSAESIKKKIEESLIQLKALPPGMGVPTEFREIVDSIKVTTAGTKVTGEITITGTAITRATNKPGGGLGGFPFNPLGGR